MKKLKRKVTGLEARLAALEASQGGARAPSGPAGGELAGSYPNPTIGTVSGLDIANSSSPTGGINFLGDPVLGGGVNLYRDEPGVLGTDSSFRVGGTTNLELETTLFDYLRLDRLGASPPAADCNAAFEVGRVVFNSSEDSIYFCGQVPSIAWERLSPRVFQGRVNATAMNALLFSVPQLNVSITSGPSPASEAELRVQNDNASGSGVTITVGTTASASSAISVPANDVSAEISGTATPVLVTSSGVPGVSLMVTCTLAASNEQICVGYLNGP